MKKTFIPDYVPLNLKGSGAYGYVLEAYDRKKDIRVAIKRTHKVGGHLSREYEILSELTDCEYVVKLLDVFFTTNDDEKVIQNLVFEFVPTNLENYLQNFCLRKEILPIETIKRFSKQLLIGLNFCHKKHIINRDLKPSNILLTEDDVVKICDFGCSKNIGLNNYSKSKSSPYIVTRYYRAPELFFGKIDYDTKIDIFSAGCIIAELFTLTPLFPGLSEGLQIFEYINILGIPEQKYLEQFNLSKNFYDILKKCKNIIPYSLNEILDPHNRYNKKDIDEVCDLLYHMLSWDFNKRFNAEQCLKHPFLKDFVITNKNDENDFFKFKN